MKTLKKISILFLATVLSTSIISCSGDDGGDPSPSPAVEGQITANVGGTNFASMTMATTAMKVETGGAYTITIQGSDASGKNLRVSKMRSNLRFYRRITMISRRNTVIHLKQCAFHHCASENL